VPVRRRRGKSHRRPGLLEVQAGEIEQLDQLRLVRVRVGESIERLIQASISAQGDAMAGKS
jgi:hypothetical protein